MVQRLAHQVLNLKIGVRVPVPLPTNKKTLKSQENSKKHSTVILKAISAQRLARPAYTATPGPPTNHPISRLSIERY